MMHVQHCCFSYYWRCRCRRHRRILRSLLLSSAHPWTSVILAGKRGSRRHSTTSFTKNVQVAETSYQMLVVLSFCDRKRVWPPSLKVTVLTLLVKNGKMKLSGESVFWQYAIKLEVNIQEGGFVSSAPSPLDQPTRHAVRCVSLNDLFHFFVVAIRTVPDRFSCPHETLSGMV